MVWHFFVTWVGDFASKRNEGSLTANRLSADADAKRPTADRFSLTAYAADSTMASQLGRHVQQSIVHTDVTLIESRNQSIRISRRV